MASSAGPEHRKREKKILEALQGYAGHEELAAQTGISKEALVDSINILISERKVKLFDYNDGRGCAYKLEDPALSSKYELVHTTHTTHAPKNRFKGLGPSEMLVFQQIEAKQEWGIWTKDLKQATNIHGTQLTRILKDLEKRGLIKSVKSVQTTKKVFMLAGLEPAKEVSGGAWYSDNTFDSVLVDVLRQAVVKFVGEARSAPTLQDLTHHINKSKICNVSLAESDIKNIVQTLMYEDVLVELDDRNEITYRKVAWPLDLEESTLACIPCGVCPVAEQCHPGGVVSPETCVYWQRYLQS